MELSVIIPTYNSAVYINQTLEHLLNSTIIAPYLLEIIVVDDGSTDQTRKEVLRLASTHAKKIKYIRNKVNLGQKACIHIGLNKSKGTYALTFDDDLQYTDTHIDIIYQEILHSSFWIVGSIAKYIPSLKYYYLKKLIFFLLNLFFKKYIAAGYFSAFKIYNCKELRKKAIYNVFLFWQVPSGKLGVVEIVKQKGIRNYSNYNLTNFVKLTSTVTYRLMFLCLIYCCIPISLIAFVLSKNYFPLLYALIILVIITVALWIEKKKYADLLNLND